MKLQRALAFLENVKTKTEVVPFRRFASSTGRCAQGECIPTIFETMVTPERGGYSIKGREFIAW